MRAERRSASLLINEWICVTAQHEKILSRLGQQLYRAYKAGELTDHDACEYCSALDGIFEQAKSLRRDLKADLQRFSGKDAPTRIAQVGKAKVGMKRFLSSRILQLWDDRNMPGYRETAKDTILLLANRAITCADRRDPLIDSHEHRRLCKLALALEEDCRNRWKQILDAKEGKRKMSALSLDTIAMNFAVSFASFLKRHKHGKKFLKLIRYNETVEVAKLMARFASRPEGETLRQEMGMAV